MTITAPNEIPTPRETPSLVGAIELSAEDHALAAIAFHL